MTIEATFTNMFRSRDDGRKAPSALETKPQVVAKPKQEQIVSAAAKPIPSAPEPVWKAYGLDVSGTALDCDVARIQRII
jgi:hypothetical protein